MANIDFPLLLENEGGTFSDIQIRTIKKVIKEDQCEMHIIYINAHKVILGSTSIMLTRFILNNSLLDFVTLDMDYESTMCMLALVYNTKRLLDRFPLSILNNKQRSNIWGFLVSINIKPNEISIRLVSNLLKYLDLKEIKYIHKYLDELTNEGWKFEIVLNK